MLKHNGCEPDNNYTLKSDAHKLISFEFLFKLPANMQSRLDPTNNAVDTCIPYGPRITLHARAPQSNCCVSGHGFFRLFLRLLTMRHMRNSYAIALVSPARWTRHNHQYAFLYLFCFSFANSMEIFAWIY